MLRRGLAVLALLAVTALGCMMAGVWLWGQYHFGAAGRALANNQLPEAQEHIRKCLTVWRDNAEVHFRAARIARRALNFPQAGYHLGECRRLRKNYDPYTREASLLLVQQGAVDRFEPVFRPDVEQDHPDSALILEAFTEGYISLYRLPEAEWCLNLWQQRDPDNLFIYLFRGWIRERVPNYQEAAAEYRRAVELNPNYDEARLRLANALLEVNLIVEAAEHLDQLRRRHTADPTVLLRLARCKHILGQPGEAYQILDELQAHDPKYPPALVLRGQLALQEGRPEEGAAWLKQALDVAPYDREGNYAYHQCLHQSGKSAEAQEQLARFRRIETDLKAMHEIVSVKMGHNPHDPDLHCEVGLIHLRLGDEKEGLIWLRRALQIDPRHQRAHASLAEFYQRVGNVKRAAEHERLGAAPDNPSPARWLENAAGGW